MRILLIVFFLNVCGCPQALSLAISDILEIVKLSEDVVTDVVKTFKLLYEDVGLSSKVKGQKDLFKEINILKNKIDMLSAEMGIESQVLYAMVGYTDLQFEQKLKIMEVIRNIDVIKLKYKNMGTFIKSKAAYDDLTLEEFARSVVSHSNSLLDRIHAFIAPGEWSGEVEGFWILINIMKERENRIFCNMQTSEQQLYLRLYNTLALTELKGFLMIEFSYMLLKLHNQGNFTKEIEAAQERYKHRSATTLKSFIRAATLGKSYLWKCDPYKHVKNETYIEITELFQGYIENSMDIFCRCLGCDDYKVTRSRNCYQGDRSPTFRKNNRRCKGNLINCTTIEDGAACLAHADTNRRYHYIKHGDWGLSGSYGYGSYGYGSCRVVANFEQYDMGKVGIRCYNCMCLCDDPGVNSDRYFSLRSSESDIGHNMVVTGLRFVKKNRIIHLQIQQGKLLPRAKIDVATVHWKPVEDYKINDPGVRAGQDYHMLTYDKRGFDLDDLLGKDDELVTGVRFEVIGNHLNFQIRLTAFNFTSGTLKVGETRWNNYLASPQNRRKLNLDEKDIPLRVHHHSRSGSRTHAYLEFTNTDLTLDVAQTTVPFIDAQAVTSAKPVPLRGAGVLSEQYVRSGGFIYPKITTFDYSRLFDDNDTHFGKIVVYKK